MGCDPIELGLWPRTADEVVTVAASSIASDPGQSIVIARKPGIAIASGDFVGLEITGVRGKDWYGLNNGEVLPPRFNARKLSTVAGTLVLRFWYFQEGIDPATQMLAVLSQAQGGTAAALRLPTETNPGDGTSNNRAGVSTWSRGMFFVGTGWDRMDGHQYTLGDGLVDTRNHLDSNAFGLIWNDRNSVVDRLRQPDSFAFQASLAAGTSIAATGIKLSLTLTQDAKLKFASVSPVSGVPTNAVIGLQVVRSAVTYLIGSTGPLAATLNVTASPGFTTPNASASSEIPLLSGDTIQLNVLVAAGAACTADFALGLARQRFAF